MDNSLTKQKKVKTKSGRVGSFFLGWFVGFLLTIALLVGAGSFVYFKVSASWINKHFKAGIDLPYDLNSLTISDVVSGAINLGKNIDTYTINDLEKDFGVTVKDKVFGIDISDLKTVAFKNLSNSLSDKFKNISAAELQDLVEFPTSLNDFLNENANTYYVKDNKLYTDQACSPEHEVTDFQYTISGNKVTVKDYSKDIIDNKVELTIYYLPISIAFNSLNFSEDMTLSDLEKYGFDVGNTFLSELPKDTTLSELEGKINEIKIAKFLGYEIDEPTGKVYKDKTHTPDNEVKGLEAFIANKSIGDLNDGLTITLGNIFDESEFTTPGSLLYLLRNSTTKSVEELPTLLEEELSNAKLSTLIDAGIIEGDFANKKLGNKDLAEYQLQELINYILSNVVTG